MNAVAAADHRRELVFAALWPAMTSRSIFTSAMRMSADCTICTANAVSTMSLLVRPKWSQRLAGALMFSATLVVKAMTS